MSLGTRIKEALGAPLSDDAAHGEVDHRTPGSFPVDDVENHESTSQRNKLHKPDDPRGWNNAEHTHGHKHADSGVGLTETSHLPKPRDEDLGRSTAMEPRTEPVSMSNSTAGPIESVSGGNYARYNSDLKRDGNHGGIATGAATSGLASHYAESPASKEQTDLANIGAGQSADTAANWGDLPHGTGIYNTVTGHGSSEDQDPHRGTKHTAVGTSNSGVPSSPERTFMLRPEHHDVMDNVARNPDTKQSDHFRTKEEALIGTGIAAGAAGLAGHELSREHGTRDARDPIATEVSPLSRQAVDTKSDAAHAPGSAFTQKHDDSLLKHESKDNQDTSPSGTKERRNSKLASIFHHDHDPNKDANKQEKEFHKEAEREAKKAQHDAQKAAAHDAKKADKEARHEAKKSDHDAKHAAQKAEKEANQKAQRQREHEAAEVAAAAAAASAAAGYTAHSHADDSRHDAKERPSEDSKDSKDSKGEKGSKLRALFHRSHKDKDDKDDKSPEEPSHTLTKKHGYERDLTAASAATYGISKLGPEHHDNSSSPRDKQKIDTLATGSDDVHPAKPDHAARNTALAGAGVGAVGAAGHNAQSRNNGQHIANSSAVESGTKTGLAPEPSMTTGVTRDNVPVTSGPSKPLTNSETKEPTHDKSAHTTRDVAAGAGVAGVAGAAGAFAHHRDHQQQHNAVSKTFGSTSANQAGTDPSIPTSHTSKDPSHGGAHNVLPSETPSGIAAGVDRSSGGSNTSAPTKHVIPDPTIPTSQKSKDPSHGGLYNVLPSGTPSGINPDYGKSGGAKSPMAQGESHEQSGAKSAGALAGGLGLGAMAATNIARKPVNDDNHIEGVVPRDGVGHKAAAGTGRERVVHKCHKCGEENDITSYIRQ